MKKKLITWAAICFSFATHLVGCPTCVGRLAKGDDPFFTDGYYQKNITQSSGTISQEDTPDIENELGGTDEESD